jgi:hypothetical protein
LNLILFLVRVKEKISSLSEYLFSHCCAFSTTEALAALAINKHGQMHINKRDWCKRLILVASELVVGYNLFEHNFSIDGKIASWVLAILLTTAKR